MKRLMTSAAMAALLATGALAESHVAPDATTAMSMPATGYEASDLMGQSVYTAKADGSGYDAIGNVNDILVTMDGSAPAVIVGVGGFLGIGEKSVALPLDQIAIQADDSGNPMLVVDQTADQLKALPNYEPTDLATMETAPAMPDSTMSATATDTAGTAPAADATATAPADNSATASADMSATTPSAETGMASAGPDVARDGYTVMSYGDVTAEALTGAAVYDVSDDNIGKISDLVVDADGKITDVVVDVGGFLGIGAKSVEVPFDQVTVLKASADAQADVRAYIDTTRDALEAMPEFEG